MVFVDDADKLGLVVSDAGPADVCLVEDLKRKVVQEKHVASQAGHGASARTVLLPFLCLHRAQWKNRTLNTTEDK